jgi:hypothetical protein
MAPQRLSEGSRRTLLTLRGADGVSDDDIHHLTAATGPPFPEKPIVANFAAHRLHPPLMESAGITLPDPTPLGYVDVSTTPPTQGVLHHTHDRPSTSPATLPSDRQAARTGRSRTRQRLQTGESLHPSTSRPHVASGTETHGLIR